MMQALRIVMFQLLVQSMPFGELLDQIEIYKQMNGISKPKRDNFIDDVIPYII